MKAGFYYNKASNIIYWYNGKRKTEFLTIYGWSKSCISGLKLKNYGNFIFIGE